MGNVSTEKVAELVILIDNNLVYAAVNNVGATTAGGAKDSISTRVSFELETAKVMLMSLALIHACRSTIWFGMMDSPPMLVPFFTKYFRMNAIGRDGISANGASISKNVTSDMYAILLLDESLMSGRTPQVKQHSWMSTYFPIQQMIEQV